MDLSCLIDLIALHATLPRHLAASEYRPADLHVAARLKTRVTFSVYPFEASLLCAKPARALRPNVVGAKR